MKSLVLAEKPSVAKEIARVLGCDEKKKHYYEGKNYLVTWALGHLIELKMPEHYNTQYKNWNIDDLPIIPKKMELMPIKQTMNQYRGIQNLIKRNDLKDCIIATDAGREGELVARWILKQLRWKKPLQRLWISSQTDQAIKAGFKQLKPSKNYDSLYESAVCRAEADWLIGLNVTRALTTKFNDQLSAGRVQTPSLAILLERESEIRNFRPQPYWHINATIANYDAILIKNKQTKLKSKQLADEIIAKCSGKGAVLKDKNSTIKSEQQPLPYDLTELQIDANKRFNFSAKKTSNVLQRLYEQHKLVTYPRTDSRYLSNDIKNTMIDRLHGISSAYNSEVKEILKNGGSVIANRVFQNDKVTDHHAIIPTEQYLDLQALDNDERKLYDLIVKRFLALFYEQYKYEILNLTFEVEGELFQAKTVKPVKMGFRSLFERDDTVSKAGLNVVVGNKYNVTSLKAVEKLTEPPKRYSEADLLKRMEKFGLGTPATRADIIERLLHTETIERNNNLLQPTKKGEQLIALVNDDLKSPQLTAKWEAELELIALGKGNAADFMTKIKKQTAQFVSEIKMSDKSYRHHNLTGSKCPDCDSFLRERNTKDGKILICTNNDCRYRRRKDPKLSNRRCPQCHKRMEIHDGKAGAYFQCRRCNIVEKAEKRQKAVTKREERKLVQKYTKKDDSFGTSLGDLLKLALEEKDDK